MRKLGTIALTAMMIGGSVAWAAPASASTTEYLPVPGITVIGAVGNGAWMGTLTATGCVWQYIGPNPLNADYDVVGSIFNDTIVVADAANSSWCGALLQPMNQAGHVFQLHGNAGDDILYGGGSVQNENWIWGDAGNDKLYLGHGGEKGDGGDGNDFVYGSDNPGDILIGGAGNDVLCAHRSSMSTAVAIDGGDGYDTECAGAAHLNNSIEAVNCSACGAGY